MTYRHRNISQATTLLSALKKMDTLNSKLLIVEEDDKFIGLLSAGDIQRAIIKGISLKEKVSTVLRDDIKVAFSGDSLDSIKRMMLEYRMEFCPVISEDQKILAIHYWEDMFLEQKPWIARQFNLPVVIMAGGQGARLKPLTNVLPKPLVPINEKTILEEIIDLYAKHGCKNYFISVNYKADLIKYYINKLGLPFNISFVEESIPMGTAGSLSLLRDKVQQTFFVTNCDILIKQDYSEILDYHHDQKNEITIVSALKHFPIKYGTLETGKNGRLKELTEKPELTFKINSGMYILEPHLISEIPQNRKSDITELIWSLNKANRKVGVFPVSGNSWVDIGDLKDYMDILRTRTII